MPVSTSYLKADLTLLFIAFLWGSTFVMVKDAVTGFPVFAFLALRFLFGVAALVVIQASGKNGAGAKRLDRRTLIGGVGTGFLFFLGYAFQTAGLRFTTSGKAGFITGISVILVPLLGWIVFRSRVRPPAIAGAFTALAGLYLLAWNPEQGASLPGRGDFLVLLCAFAFAGHILAISRFARDADEYAFSGIQMAAVAVFSIAAALFEGPVPTPSLSVLATAAFTGIVVTALVLVWQTRAQRVAPAEHAAVIFTMEPVFAALFGYLLAGEVLTPRQLAGAALILAGMVVSEVGQLLLRPRRQVERPVNGRRARCS